MLKNNSFNRWLLFISSVGIIFLIIWNTFSFFKILKENERIKMEIWATAQEDIKKSDQGTNIPSNKVASVFWSVS